MRRTISALIVSVLCAFGARAQWTIGLTETTQHLDSVCGGSGHPLADGTEIRIYHDWNSNGPDDLDTLLRICDDPPDCIAGPNGSVNFNTFWINGANQPFCMPAFPGGFSTLCPPLERFVYCAYTDPAPNRIYLRVCFGPRHYYSEVISPLGGGSISDYEISTWTCVEAPCPGCEPPPRITQMSATPGCRAIDLAWAYSEVPYPADSVYVMRRRGSEGIPVQVATLLPADTLFHDMITDAMSFVFEYHYWIKAKHRCDSSATYAYSPVASARPDDRALWGQQLHVDATDTVFDSVKVTWCYRQQMRCDDPDSFIIMSSNPTRRWGAVAWRFRQTNYALSCHPPLGETIYYYIDYWSRGCGQYSSGSLPDPGTALDYSDTVDSSDGILPTSFRLYANYPNPFNSRTRINFDLPRAARVTMTVFNISGQRVAALVDGMVGAGNHAVDFDAAGLPSGVYIVRMEAEGWTLSRKMLLLK